MKVKKDRKIKNYVKENILQSAIKCFQKNGFRGTSMADIAKGADITIATIYFYFKNKKTLFDALNRPDLDFPSPKLTERKDDIIRAARNVFSEQGYAGASMDNVAKASGITKAALYIYFAGKEELFNAVIKNDPIFDFTNLLGIDITSLESKISKNNSQMLEHLFYKIALGYLNMFKDKTILNLLKIVLTEGTRDYNIAYVFKKTAILQGSQTISKLLARFGFELNTELQKISQSFMGMLASWVIVHRLLPNDPKKQNQDFKDNEEDEAKRSARLFIYGLNDYKSE